MEEGLQHHVHSRVGWLKFDFLTVQVRYRYGTGTVQVQYRYSTAVRSTGL